MPTMPDKNKTGEKDEGINSEKGGGKGPSVGHPDKGAVQAQQEQPDDYVEFTGKLVAAVNGKAFIDVEVNEDTATAEFNTSDIDSWDEKKYSVGSKHKYRIHRGVFTAAVTQTDAFKAHEKMLEQDHGAVGHDAGAGTAG